MDTDKLWALLDAFRFDEPDRDIDKACACGCKEHIMEDDQQVCKACGNVLGRVLNTMAEWRYYGNDDTRQDDPTRCGMPVNDLLPKSSMTTVMGGGSRNFEVRKMKKYQMWNSMCHTERTLHKIFDQITNNTAKYGINAKILADAKILYKNASEKKISRGNNKEGLIASCFYYACCLNKVPRSPKEVAKIFGIDLVVLTKGNARIQNLLHINVESSEPEDFIARFGSKLNMNYDDIEKCKKLSQVLDELQIISENAPTSVAAGTLYYYCIKHKLDYDKKQIAEACDVSPMTIAKCFNTLTSFDSLICEKGK